MGKMDEIKYQRNEIKVLDTEEIYNRGCYGGK
jgi:hypothetical protein